MSEIVISFSETTIYPQGQESKSVRPPPEFYDLVAGLSSEVERSGAEVAKTTGGGVIESSWAPRAGNKFFRPGPKYYPTDIHEIVVTITWAFGGAAAFAMFANHSTSAIKNMIELLGKYRSRTEEAKVEAIVNGRRVEVRDGADLERIVANVIAEDTH